MESVYCLICFTNSFERVSNEMIDWKGSVKATFDQFGNLGTTLESSKGGSLPDATCDELEGTSGNFMARGSHSDDTRGAPSTMTGFQSRTHHFGITSTVKGIVYTPIRHFSSNMLLNGYVDILWIDAMSGSKFLGHFKFLWINVDDNDLGCTGLFGTLNDSQSLECWYGVKAVRN
jgi:hypothetical protein